MEVADIGPDESSVADHGLAADEHVTSRTRRAEDESRLRVDDVGDVVPGPNHHVTSGPDLEAPDVVSPEASRPALGGEPDRVGREERRRVQAALARQEQRHPKLR